MILGVTARDSFRCKPFGCNDDDAPTAPASKQLQAGKAGKTAKAAKADKQLHVVSCLDL